MIPERVLEFYEAAENRWKRRALRYRAELRNRETAADALAEALEDAEELCNILACALAAYDPDFVDKLEPDEQKLWDCVQPFGPDDST